MMMNRPQILKNHNYAVWPHLLPPPLLPEDFTTVIWTSQRHFFDVSKNSSRRSDQKKEVRRNGRNMSDLQSQNRLKPRWFGRKKFNKNNKRLVPFAPRNTTSFIIRAKKSGGIASLISPCPVTPTVIPTPVFSPSSEVLGDMVKEEWGVDGYGSMKGLIRLRSPGFEARETDEEEENGSSKIDVERRLDHDLSRFEMIYNPNSNNENLTWKDRLILLEKELNDLRRRVFCLETTGRKDAADNDGSGGHDSSEKSVGNGNGGGAD